MSAFLQLTGVAAILKGMGDAIDAALGPQEFWVGSAVPYGPFHEFGTSKLTARPHWALAIALISEKYHLSSVQDQQMLVNAMLEAPRGLVRIIAFDLERAVKIQINVQHVIDTSNYFGSIATGPSEADAFQSSLSKTIK